MSPCHLRAQNCRVEAVPKTPLKKGNCCLCPPGLSPLGCPSPRLALSLSQGSVPFPAVPTRGRCCPPSHQCSQTTPGAGETSAEGKSGDSQHLLSFSIPDFLSLQQQLPLGGRNLCWELPGELRKTFGSRCFPPPLFSLRVQRGWRVSVCESLMCGGFLELGETAAMGTWNCSLSFHPVEIEIFGLYQLCLMIDS